MRKSRGKAARGLTEIGRDLLAMEISTIESDTITGRKMPWFPHAVIDILSKYADWLADVGKLDVDKILALEKPLTPEVLVEIARGGGEPGAAAISNGLRHVEQLRLAAKMIVDNELMERVGGNQLDDVARGIAHRIRRNCDQLKAMVIRFRTMKSWRTYLLTPSARNMVAGSGRAGGERGLGWGAGSDDSAEFGEIDKGLTRVQIAESVSAAKEDGEEPVLDSDASTRLRKIWELGTDVVVAQTIVHIDGDTVTRLQSGLGEGERAYLLEVHNRAVGTATSQWKVRRVRGVGGRGGESALRWSQVGLTGVWSDAPVAYPGPHPGVPSSRGTVDVPARGGDRRDAPLRSLGNADDHPAGRGCADIRDRVGGGRCGA